MYTATKKQPQQQQPPPPRRRRRRRPEPSGHPSNAVVSLSKYIWSMKTLVIVVLAVWIAHMNQDSNFDTMTTIKDISSIVAWMTVTLQHIWYQIVDVCNIDMIRNHPDWILWSTAFYAASFDTYRAILSTFILLTITTKYILQWIRYILLRIVFPNGTKVINTYILPQLYTQGHYILTQLILYHSQLTTEQLCYEALCLTCGILFYYYCVPYIVRILPIIQKLIRSIQKWYNHQYELLLYSSRLLAIMTPFILYCWMVLFVQLLIPSVVYFVVIHTNCNTILSIYIPIILSIVLLHNDSDDVQEDEDDKRDSAITTVITTVEPTSCTHTLESDKVASTLPTTTTTTATTKKTSLRKSQRIQSKQSQKENIIVSMNNNINNDQTKKETHHGTHITKSSFTTQRKRNDSTSTISTTTAATTTKTTTTTTTNTGSSPTIQQLLIQYWIIVRMVSCIYILGIQSIPSWIRRLGFVVLRMSSSSSSSFNNSIYPHFEFYLYMSVVIIPIITPTIIQDMISSSSSTSTTNTSSTTTTPPTSRKDIIESNSRKTTLIQVYYIQYYILPLVSSVYNTISSSISISTYESYVIVPSTKFLSVVSYTSMLSEPTCQYLTQLIHDGRTILIPSIMALFVQSYPIQYMFVLYIAYIVPLYKCCIDTDTTLPFTTNQQQQQQQRYRTTQQWLQYWIIQTILTSTVQSVSSILYWIPFSTTLLYCFYVYITIILSPSTISHIYEQYIHGEIQYLIHFVTASTMSTTGTNTTNNVTNNHHENNVDSLHSSHTIQLWNYILDRVPKAKTEESITTPMTTTVNHPSPTDDNNENDETTSCAE